VEIENYPLHFDGHWAIDIDALKKIKNKKLRALTLVNPNNPTGSYVKTSELKAVNAFCAGRGIALISDEVFQEFVIDGHPQRASLAGNTDVLTFTLGGLSKTLGLPQMKLSWILVSGPDELVNSALARLEVIADTYLSVNTPVQRALSRWLDFQPKIHEQIRRRLMDNYNSLKNIFGPISSAHCLPAEGGWYATIKLPDAVDEEEWALTCLKEDRVFVHPGYFFDFTEEPFTVVSLLPPVEEFREGIQRMVNRVNKFETRNSKL
jgi:aspartate/methionine/tyrosine aminotransferase